MEYFQLIQQRYSCKQYDSRPVGHDLLVRILEAGRLAPTGRNLQKWHLYVIEKPCDLEKIDQATRCRYGAPVVLLMSWDARQAKENQVGARDAAFEDTCIVMTQIMLAAKDCGVDSCWINRFDPVLVKSLFELPQQEEAAMLMDLGYPAAGSAPQGNHFKRKPLTDLVTWL